MSFRTLGLLALLGLSSCTREVVVTPATGPEAQRNVVEVMGSGDAEASPDIVRVTLGVEARGPNVQEAVATTNDKMRAVLEALAKHGVEPKDVQTQQLNIHAEERPPEPPPQPMPMPGPRGAKPGAPAPEAPPLPPPVVYRVSNGVQVTVRNVQRVGEVVGAAVQAGANQAWGIHFDVDDKKVLVTQAQQKAIEDAQRRARQLAQAAGVRLGRVVSITEAGARDFPGPMPMGMEVAYSRSDVPMQAGTLRVTQSVRVVYEISR